MERVVLHLSDPEFKCLDAFTLMNAFLGRGHALSLHIDRRDYTEIITYSRTEGGDTTARSACVSRLDCGCP